MSTPTFHLVRQAREQNYRLTAEQTTALNKKIQQTVQFNAPDRDDMHEAVHLGNAAIVQTLIKSPKLNAEQKSTLADIGLVAWTQNNLGSKESAKIVQVLASVANYQVRTAKGETIAETFASSLGRMEIQEQEQATKRNLSAPVSSGAKVQLKEAWKALEEAGIDMGKAKELRQQARAPKVFTVSRQTPTVKPISQPKSL